ncbi:MAG TPA: MFS transporter, partial [Anaerolineales bacterium]|nr:MFS transporter [Anaerolineales bacterium]
MARKAISDEKQRRRQHWAWYMYDFGNSAYAAVILLAVYSAYFKGQVVGGVAGSRLWGLALGAAMLVVAVLSPFLGAIADFAASKKRMLLVFSGLSWIFTALLFFVQKGDVVMGFVFFVLAEIGYRGGQVFYNALLPEIASPDEIGQVSGNGWAIGSIGGVVCLLFILPAIVLTKSNPALNLLVVRSSFIFTALFFAAAASLLFLRVKETRKGRTLPPGESYLSISLKRLVATFKAVRHFRQFIAFIVSFLIYNDGILMALDFAAIIGAVLFGMTQTQLILFMILVQVTSAAGAYLFGLLGEKIGFKKALLLSLVLMIAAVVWMIFNPSLAGYFVIGGLAGFALTGVQSLSRTMAGLFAPASKSAEFFGFFAVAGKSSSFIGPATFGLLAAGLAQYFQKGGLDPVKAEQDGTRAGLLVIALFLLVGTLILLFVNEKRARLA